MSVDRARDLVAQGMTIAEAAEYLGINYNTLRRQIGEAKREAAIDIPPSKPIGYEAPLRIDDADAVVMGDLHIPHHSQVMLKRMIELRNIRFPGVRRLIFGGDLFDFASLSSHQHNQPEASFDATIQLAGEVLYAILEHFDEAIFMSGNHDERLGKRLDQPLNLDLLINMVFGKKWPKANIRVTNLDYIYFGKDWLIGHPSNYSGFGGKTPAELADIHQKNVITFHNHCFGKMASKSGDFVGIDAGCMTNADEHYYRHRRLAKFTQWQRGFVVLRDGYPFDFPEKWTNWRSLGID